MNINLDTLLAPLERAIDEHPRLTRQQSREPWLCIDRHGCTARVMVKFRGSRKIRYDEIHGIGDTPEEAVSKLIGGLNFWAEALK